jgi:SOUL heme-binding protein
MGMIFGKETVAEPSYKVLLSSLQAATTPYEIRQYGVRYAAQTIYPMGTSTNVPFSKLAKYIGVFGTPNNIGNQPIAMTAPVSMSTAKVASSKEEHQQGPVAIAMTAPVSMKAVTTTTAATTEPHQVMTFYLPSIYNENPDSIPQPTPDSDVTITCVPGAIGAVHRFSGTMDTRTARTHAIQLKQQLSVDGMTFHEDPINDKGNDKLPLDFYEAWGYNPPFTLPAFRRNEVWIELTKEQLQHLINKQQQLKSSEMN